VTAVHAHAVADAPAVVAPTAWDNPETVAPRGTLIVIAGRGEHAALYQRFGARLAFDGYRVRAVSDPTRDAAAVTDEIARLLDDPTLPAPRVLVGSDAGALFAVLLASTTDLPLDALILAGLPTRTASSHATIGDWDAELDQRTACSAHRGRLSGDDAVLRGALAVRLPADWFDTAQLANVRVPVLGIHGADDTVAPLRAARAEYASAPNATLVSITNGKHDALNDATHRTAAATVVLFLERLRLGSNLPAIAVTEPPVTELPVTEPQGAGA
jgi:alpha-beta hydrolase superfamily lysophospholipase